MSGLEHRDGVVWFKAPLPRRWHRCAPCTSGDVGGEIVQRCACGAIRLSTIGVWLHRNSRRGPWWRRSR